MRVIGRKVLRGERGAPKKQALPHKVSNKQHLKGIRDGREYGTQKSRLGKGTNTS